MSARFKQPKLLEEGEIFSDRTQGPPSELLMNRAQRQTAALGQQLQNRLLLFGQIMADACRRQVAAGTEANNEDT